MIDGFFGFLLWSAVQKELGSISASRNLVMICSGVYRLPCWCDPIEEIRPGDVVWIEPDEKHWHGAAPNNAMTYISVVETTEEDYNGWMEHVSDEQYHDNPLT